MIDANTEVRIETENEMWGKTSGAVDTWTRVLLDSNAIRVTMDSGNPTQIIESAIRRVLNDN